MMRIVSFTNNTERFPDAGTMLAYPSIFAESPGLSRRNAIEYPTDAHARAPGGLRIVAKGGPWYSPGMAMERAGRTDSRNPPARPFRLRRLVGRTLKLALLALFTAHLVYVCATATLLLVYRGTDPAATLLMAYREFLYGWKIEAPRPVKLSRIPVYIRSMLVSVEDGNFYKHRGIDMKAFERARAINARIGRPLYGGSTLSMQLARTLFLVPEKSYLRKYLEIIAALMLDAILGKERTLELYFGYAEWGKGIFGIEAASRRYYGKPVSMLERDEAARLVTLLSSPIKYRPDNFDRSGILRERYTYLYRRFVSVSGFLPDQAPALVPPLPAGDLSGTYENGEGPDSLESGAGPGETTGAMGSAEDAESPGEGAHGDEEPISSSRVPGGTANTGRESGDPEAGGAGASVPAIDTSPGPSPGPGTVAPPAGGSPP